jgi:hypothetical protein
VAIISAVAEQIVIAARFKGPPESANGGYACGVVARRIGDSAEVNLRKPPPLEKPLTLEEGEPVRLLDGDQVVADGRPVVVEVAIPEPPSLREAEQAVEEYVGFKDHPFPGCFVCGPDREAGDGLQLFPGAVAGRQIVASPWLADASLAAEDGHVATEVVWAALDCPTGFGCDYSAAANPSVLARLRGTIVGRAEVDRPHIAIGWPIAVDGRKREGGSALFTTDGDLIAFAQGLWVELRG